MSTYLDAVRFMAAVAVFISHVSVQRFTGGFLWQSEPYGDEAVDVFFVLSGFVIAYVSNQSETTLRGYAIARLARIYSVAFPVLLVTFALDAIGIKLRPDLYSATWGYVAHGKVLQFVTSLSFTDRLWWADIHQGSDKPYWSLSFEVWYYVIFACIIFGKGRAKIVSTVIAVILAGPNIISLFPLWLIGVGCYHVCSHERDKTLGMALCIGPLLLWVTYEIWAWHGHRLTGIELPWTSNRDQILQDYVVGSLFAVHLVGFNTISSGISGVLLRFSKQIKWAAGATFTIYLFHYPITQFLTTVIPWEPSALPTRLVLFPGVLVIMFAIAELTERRKEGWRQLFANLVSHIQTAARQLHLRSA